MKQKGLKLHAESWPLLDFADEAKRRIEEDQAKVLGVLSGDLEASAFSLIPTHPIVSSLFCSKLPDLQPHPFLSSSICLSFIHENERARFISLPSFRLYLRPRASSYFSFFVLFPLFFFMSLVFRPEYLHSSTPHVRQHYRDCLARFIFISFALCASSLPLRISLGYISPHPTESAFA